MILPETIKPFFPALIRENPAHQKYMLKEYIQLMILDFLATTIYIRNIVFIGGTNLRLVKGIDRFSEDLDFDCKGLSNREFIQMTDDVLVFLQRFGMKVELRDKQKENLTAYRRNFFFPELLFEMDLSGYRDERFLVKIEAQDQGIVYQTDMVSINGFLNLLGIGHASGDDHRLSRAGHILDEWQVHCFEGSNFVRRGVQVFQ